MVSAVGALLPLADWPVYGSNGGRCPQQLKWRLRVISRSTCCAKNEPAAGTVPLGGQVVEFSWQLCPMHRVRISRRSVLFLEAVKQNASMAL